MSYGARLLIACHCEREHGDVIRVISTRKATRREPSCQSYSSSQCQAGTEGVENMAPIFEQVSGHGRGHGHDEFVARFREICEEHLRDKRARAFAFVFYDPYHETVREALREAHGFVRLDETSGKDITLFYLHDRTVDRHWRGFNEKFLDAMNIADQATLPCMVVFRFENGGFTDGSIFPLDYENKDAVTVANDMVHYLRATIETMKKEGDPSALTVLPKAALRLGGLARLADFLMKMKGWS